MGEDLKEQEILNLALEEPSYFSVLVDRYKVHFIRKAMGIVHTSEEAEDIVQETFTKIYRYAHKFKKQKGIEFKSWAYKILMNTAFTHYQKLKKISVNVEYLDPVLYEDDSLEETKDLASINDAKELVKAIIDKMPEHLGRVLKLYFLDDKSYDAICKLEDISIPTLKMRLFRAKRLFKKLSTDL